MRAVVVVCLCAFGGGQLPIVRQHTAGQERGVARFKASCSRRPLGEDEDDSFLPESNSGCGNYSGTMGVY